MLASPQLFCVSALRGEGEAVSRCGTRNQTYRTFGGIMTHATVARIPRISQRRLLKAIQRLGGRIETSKDGEKSLRIPGGLLRFDLEIHRGALTPLGYWGGDVFHDPDQAPLVMRINDLNGGEVPGVVSAFQCGNSPNHSHVLVCGPPLLAEYATDAQLDLLIAGYAKKMVRAFHALDREFSESTVPLPRGTGLRLAQRRKESTRYGVAEVSLQRIADLAQTMSFGATSVSVTGAVAQGYVLIVVDGLQIRVGHARDGSGDVELMTYAPAARCACYWPNVVQWAIDVNEAQSEVSARIISAPDDSTLVFNGYALIPTDCGYTNEQLAYQVDGLIR